MKKLLSVLLLICLLLASCSYDDIEDTDDKTDPSGTKSVYGNYDYSLKPYFSDNYFFYQDKIFCVGVHMRYVMLGDLTPDADISKTAPEEYMLSIHYTCPYDVEHCHRALNGDDECPIKSGSNRVTLLDNYESAGSYPIFYFAFCRNSQVDQSIYEPTKPYCLYRYDSGSNIREKLTELPGYVEQMMAYGDKIYLSVSLSSLKNQLMVYDKKTKELSSHKAGKGGLKYIYADESGVYFVDRKDGSLYKADADLTSSEKLYTLDNDSIYELSRESTGSLGMRIYDGYLYYRTNFETSPMQVHVNGIADEDNPNPQYINPVHYDIRRLPLDSLTSDGELVAEDFFETCELGFAGGALYYTPNDYAPHGPDGGYYNFSNGRLCKFDLKTLECTDVVKEGSGLLFDRGIMTYVTERFVFATIRPLDEPWITNWNGNSPAFHAIYDLETGSLYSVVDNEC